jgi:hypothetical protein
MATRLISLQSMRGRTRKTFQHALAILLLMLPMYFAAAQEQDAQESAPAQKTSSQPSQPAATASPLQAQQPSFPGAPLILPAGTKLQVGLLRALSIKHTKPGDSVYLQITFPVTAENRMAVPPGAYLQGAIDKITRRDRASAVLEFDMRSVSLIYSTGYTVSLAGPLTALPTAAGLRLPDMRNPHDIPVAMGAAGTTAVPSLPMPSLGNGPRNAMIALGVVAAAGTAVILVAANRSDTEMAVGTQLEIMLPAAVELDRERVTAAVQQYSSQAANAPPQIVKPPEKPKMCYDPGSPGTPDTVIPGSPETPPTVIPGMNGAPDTVIPGTPATPDTVIPGTPGTPGHEYPCPK